MTDLAVHKVRIHGAVPGSAPWAAAEALLQAMAPTGGDHSVLIVRRLRLDGFRGDEARDRLAALCRRAVRPALAATGITPGAEAVWFRDEAEALACLTADLISGSAASRWYWRSRLPTAPYGTSRLAQVWLREVRWLPATLRLLESGTPGAGVRAVAALTSAEAALLLAALLPGQLGGSAPLPTTVSRIAAKPGEHLSGPSPPLPPAPRTAARWTRLLPVGVMSLPPGPRELLAVAMVLAAEPAAATGELRAWARAVDRRAARTIADAGEWLATASGAKKWLPATSDPPAGGRSPDRTVISAVADQSRTEIIAEPDERPGSAVIEVSRSNGAEIAEPSPEPALIDTDLVLAADPTRPMRPDDEPEPPAYGPLDRWPDAVWSGHATACYLLNLLLRCAEEPSWADLLRFTRRVLRGRPGVRRRARDPLWPLLRGLSGADRISAPPVPTWWQPALGYLGEHRLGPEVFAQPGEISVTRTHVDVVLDIEQTDLAVRIIGLDQNPGWVRSLGRVVSFHFEDARRSLP
jgi:hypothetical protein